MAVELETERLRLRQFREDDLDAYCGFLSDPLTEATQGPALGRGHVWRDIAKILGHWQLRGYGLWALEEKSTGSFAGHAGLWFPAGWNDIEVGYGLAPRHRGQGLATEAAACARDYGYKIGIARLVSYILPTNEASQRVARRLQAKPEGAFMINDVPHITYLHQKP